MNDENTTNSEDEMKDERPDETAADCERTDVSDSPSEDGASPPDDGVSPPDPDEEDHVLTPDGLNYPDLTFDDDGLDPVCGFSLARSLDIEEMEEWLNDLSDALRSHDLGVTAADGHVVFGIAPAGVELTYEPEDEGERTGELELSMRMRAKVMACSDDPEEKTGARAGSGFIPIAMITDPDGTYRCYNWIDDPFDSFDRNIFDE